MVLHHRKVAFVVKNWLSKAGYQYCFEFLTIIYAFLKMAKYCGYCKKLNILISQCFHYWLHMLSNIHGAVWSISMGEKRHRLIGSNQKQFRTPNQKEVFGHASFADHEIFFLFLHIGFYYKFGEFIVVCVHHSKMSLCSMVTFIIKSELNSF